MLTLRLTQFTEAEDKYRVEVALEGDGVPRQTATSPLNFKLTPQEQEDLRWYLEDFLEQPYEAEQKIAARIEKHMAEIGVKLFNAVFQANADACDLWATLRDKLDDTRVEIIVGVTEATAIPWELLRDPKTDAALALRAQAFVRSQLQAAQRPQLPSKNSGPIRILLVICRPAGREDVPFRSVASFLIKGLSASAAQAFQLDVLRPPTFEQLNKTLRSAKAGGKPYHVVHFDGHGDFFDMGNLFVNWKDKTEEEIMQLLASLINFDPNRFSPQAIYPQTPREGRRGYLAFENPKSVHNLRFVDGQELGKLLAETDVPALMLNACRSAYAEAPTAPLPTEDDPNTQVRAFGSFTQEIMDAGAAGVVAMRYTVYVVTAAQFVADLYAALTQGYSLGEAVTLGRKQLAADPNRSIAYDPRPLQDWPVPVVYEAAPIKLFPKPKQVKKLSITLKAGAATTPHTRSSLAPNLPAQPDAGFYGRDETLLGLDRAFDQHAAACLCRQRQNHHGRGVCPLV
ncbi:MAG: CHAT domain-containing protein [bacterium]